MSGWTRRNQNGVLALLAAVVASAVPVAAQDRAVNTEPPTLDVRIERALEGQDWDRLVEILGPILQRPNPQTPDRYWFYMGLAQCRRNRMPQAVYYLREALERTPECAVTAEMLAEAATRTGKDEVLAKCVSRHPNNARVLMWSGVRELLKGDAEKERELPKTHRDYNSLVHVPPGHSDAEKHYRSAEARLLTACELQRNDIQPHLWLARVYVRLQDHPSAIEQLLVADAIAPLRFSDYELLANLYSSQGKYSEALQTIETAEEVAERPTLESVKLKATLLSRLQRYKEAAELYRLLLNHDKKLRKIRGDLGRMAFADGDYALALFAFRESYIVDSNLDSLARVGMCALELGQEDLARDYIEQAIRESIQRHGEGFQIPSDWIFARGRAKWKGGDQLGALDDLLDAVRKDPGNPAKTRWAVFVCKEVKAPHGLIDVARLWARYGNEKEAIELLHYVRSHWFFPVSRDHRGRRMISHQRRCDLALAQIYDRNKRWRSAYQLWRSALLGWSPWSCWLAVRAGELEAASKGFAQFTSSEDPDLRTHGWLGRGYLALVDKDAVAARQVAERLRGTRYSWLADSLEQSADLFESASECHTLDPVASLGIFGTDFIRRGLHRGLRVEAIVPGSAASKSDIVILPGDVVLRVADVPLDGEDRVARLRKRDTYPESITITVLREGREFDVDIHMAASKHTTR